eukprot:7547024-Karenia_brevis.AAC.1
MAMSNVVKRHFGIFRCSKVKFSAGKGRLFPQLVAEAVKELWQRGVVTELCRTLAWAYPNAIVLHRSR